VTIDGVTLGIDRKESGIIAEILVDEAAAVPVGKSLAIIVDGAEDYEAFMAKFKKIEEEAPEERAGTENVESSTEQSTTSGDQVCNITLIKAVKHLIKTDVINEADDFAHQLLSLCRQGHPALLEAFDASYDGDDFNEETFEASFFIDNARAIVAKHSITPSGEEETK
jgi:pyruvate/2-oxoglutarate dehydrogenase complex dihydrolipoamide acyltransferase (E2) component